MNLKFSTAALLLVSLSGAASAESKSHRNVFPAPLPVAVESKKAAIKIYPNPSTNGTVRVVSNTAGKLHFYIFELDGTMRHQALIGEGEKHTVRNLKKGIYTYDAFYNDEGVEHGKLIIK